jgi:acetylornithine deacetylase/succinyl-diaminopimelate desuccinylase-like protein
MTIDAGTRESAIAATLAMFDSGKFRADLDRRIAYRTESQEPSQAHQLHAYLDHEIAPLLHRLGFETQQAANPGDIDAPVLLARRQESDDVPTLVTYAHGDVVRGYDEQWRTGLDPWKIVVDGDRWYGRGIADNKGQHSINLAALEAVIAARRGRLGFNIALIFETGEEIDSPGLNHVCADQREYLRGDLFLASDGPRVSAERPTVFLGSRGELSFDLEVNLREGAHHSGNWGGALRNPAVVLAHAITTLVDRNGRILVEGLMPPPLSSAVRAALADIELGRDANAPSIDLDWGEPGLTPAERVLGWNAIEILAFKSGNPDAPVNAIPPSARAHCQLRFVVGTDWQNAQRCLDDHFERHGYGNVKATVKSAVPATRLDLADPWVQWTLDSIRTTTGKNPALLPNLGGTVPNAIFANTLGLPTVWVPHSYPACSQHAPNEHLLGSVARESLAVMAGIWWDLGDSGGKVVSKRRSRAAIHNAR